MEAQTEVRRAHGERKRERESLKEGGKSKERRHTETDRKPRETHTKERRERRGMKENGKEVKAMGLYGEKDCESKREKTGERDKGMENGEKG